jgi:undecaprenyl-diphosphatase
VHETLAGLVGTYGYVLLFALVGLESAGIPLPGETALVTAAALAALGHLSIVGVIGTAAAAAVLGDNGGYWIGRTGGIALVHRHGRLFRLDEQKLERVHAFFERHGPKTVFIGRFIALLRTWAAVLAGAARMPYGSFMTYNALGGATWAVLFGGLGYAFGHNLPALEHYIGQASLALALLVVLVAVVALLARRFDLSREALWSGAQRLWGACCALPVFRRLSQRYPRAWAFVLARLTPGEFLGLHLTLGLLLSLAAIWLFGGITEDVIHHDPLTNFDLTLAAWLRAHSTPAGDRVAVAVSLVGSPVVMSTLAIAGAAAFALRRRRILLAVWTAAFAGGGVLDWMLKEIIRRPRPVGASAFLHGASFSFPSGHAMGSLIGYGLLAYLLAVHGPVRRRARVAILVAAALLVLAIGFTRLYLGVHYFSDVVGGFAAGVVWLSVCVSGLEVALGRQAAARAQPAAAQSPALGTAAGP